MTVRAEIELLWSAEGQVAALSATIVALADALGLPAATTLDEALSNEDFNFRPAVEGFDRGEALQALLTETGFGDVEDLLDLSLNDTGLMIVSQDSLSTLALALGDIIDSLMTMTEVHQLDTTGLELAQHLSAALQGQMMVLATRDALPAQVPASLKATAVLANSLSLTVPDLPWLVDRWPVADQVSSLQGLSGLLTAFGVPAAPLHTAAMASFAQAHSGKALGDLHNHAATALDDLNAALDQWTAPLGAQTASQSQIALTQGALARAREVLEQSTGEQD